MKRLLILAALVALGGCESTVEAHQPGSVAGDVASYDAIRQAAQACNASGGTLELRRHGDSTYVSDYVCRPPPRTTAQGSSR